MLKVNNESFITDFINVLQVTLFNHSASTFVSLTRRRSTLFQLRVEGGRPMRGREVHVRRGRLYGRWQADWRHGRRINQAASGLASYAVVNDMGLPLPGEILFTKRTKNKKIRNRISALCSAMKMCI